MNKETLIEKIEYLYPQICSIEESTFRDSLQNGIISEQEKLSQEMIDYEDLYEELKTILFPMIEHYRDIFKTDVASKAKKVYFVALCEMIKNDYTTGMVKTFRYVTNQPTVDYARYYDLLQIVTDSQGLVLQRNGNIRLFERTYIEETGIPKNLTRTVIKFFNIYWKYFRNVEIEKRNRIIVDYIREGIFKEEYILDSADEKIIAAAQKELNVFPEKAIRTVSKLEKIFIALDNYPELLNAHIEDDFIEHINNVVGFNITSVLRNTDLKNIFFKYLQVVPVKKFTQKIIPNLSKSESVELPDGYEVTVKSLNENEISCGIYKIRGIHYEVVLDPMITLEDMFAYPRNQIYAFAPDYYIYTSNEYFDVESTYRYISSRRVFYKNKELYVWIGTVPPATSIFIDGNRIDSIENCYLTGKVVKYYDYETGKSSLRFAMNSFKACFPEYKYKKMTFV